MTVLDVATFPPGSDGYLKATTPKNALARQHPALVARPIDADQVAACVRYAAAHGLTVVPQATGHGAAAELGDGVLLLDTSGLDTIQIDPSARAARVGAGATWGAVQAEAFPHGLLGRSGSAPDVAVAGYHFGAGAGWLTRPWGLASGALTAVDHVDGRGAVRRATDDAADPLDRDAMWAYRGGGGVGVAVALEFGLVPVDDLWAGYLLWPADALDAVVGAWSRSLPAFGPALATSLAVLAAPPAPFIPEPLQGRWIVVLSMASSAGAADATALRTALGDAPPPAVDTWGPSDVERLGQIHLDPPAAVPGLGRARWLDDSAPSVALAALRAALDSPLSTAEIRHVANDAPARPGALDRPPGNFMLHAVGGPGDDRAAFEAALDGVVAAAEPADTGLAIGSWSDGRTSVPDALPADVRERVVAIADRADPDHVVARSTLLTPDRQESQ